MTLMISSRALSRFVSLQKKQEMCVDDREEKAAKLAAVHKMEEEERTRRIEEGMEEERRESLANLVGTGVCVCVLCLPLLCLSELIETISNIMKTNLSVCVCMCALVHKVEEEETDPPH